MNIPEGILCTQTHEWALEDNNSILVGLTDRQINELGDIVFIELPEVGSSFSKDEIFGTIESIKAASELYMPISGEILEVNETLIKTPELINESPYDSWFIKVKPDDFQNDSQDLLEYSDYIEDLS